MKVQAWGAAFAQALAQLRDDIEAEANGRAVVARTASAAAPSAGSRRRRRRPRMMPLAFTMGMMPGMMGTLTPARPASSTSGSRHRH